MRGKSRRRGLLSLKASADRISEVQAWKRGVVQLMVVEKYNPETPSTPQTKGFMYTYVMYGTTTQWRTYGAVQCLQENSPSAISLLLGVPQLPNQ